MIAIKRKTSTLFTTPINKGSKRKFTLQNEDYVNLKFSVETPLYFRLGDHIELDNDPTGLFEIVTPQAPTYNTSTGGYDYDLRFDAYYMKWRNKVMKYTPEIGGQEASFNLTAELAVHLDIVLRNLKALNYTYKGEPFTFSIDDSVAQKAKVVTYNNTNIIDALTLLAQTFECEWWVTNNIIHFGKCEQGDYITFEENVNVEKMTRSDSSTPFATRIYAFGSTRNIPTNYRPVTEQPVVNGIVQKRLMLPKGTPYIDAYEGMTQEEAVEQIVTFEDIYPKRVSEIKEEPTTKQYTDKIEHEDKTTETIKWNAYRLKYEHGDFKRDYILPGKTLRIVFQSGLLNGMEFEVIFSPDTAPKKTTEKTKETTSTEQPRTAKAAPMLKSNNGESEKEDTIHNSTEDPDKEHFHGGMSGGGSGGSGGGTSNDNTGTEETNSTEQQPDVQIFEIVRNEDYGRPLPDDVLKPKKGDKYILFNFDIQHVSDNYITQAEEELKQKAIEHVRKTMIDPSVYQCPMKYESVTSINGNFAPYDIGQRVDLRNKAYFKDGRKSRIIGFEYNLDIPQDHPTYTIGESVAYSRLAEMEGKIDELTYQGQTYNGVGGSGVYLIKSFDRTTATDYNAFSAKRALREFINKANPDTMPYLLTLLQGIKFSNAAQIDGEGKAELLSVITDVLKSYDFNSTTESGFGVTKRKDGKYQLSITDLIVWGKAVFNELEIRKLSYVGGNMVFSSCGSKIKKVVPLDKNGEELSDRVEYFTSGGKLIPANRKFLSYTKKAFRRPSKAFASAGKFIPANGGVLGCFDGNAATDAAAYRCYFHQDDGTTATTNLWEVGDQARCQTFNIKKGKYKGVSNRRYWRLVKKVGEDYIDLSATDCEKGSDVPQVGDALVQFGSRTNTDRMSLIYVVVNGDDAPAIIWYDGVKSYTLKNKRTAIVSPKEVVFNTRMFKLVNDNGEKVTTVSERGEWTQGEEYYYYDRVSYNGRLWLCIAPEGVAVTEEPSEHSDKWLLQVDKGDDNIIVDITVESGAIKNGKGSVTLYGTVYKGGKDITPNITPYRLKWTRMSSDSEADAAWNKAHAYIGRRITIQASEVKGGAYINYEFNK